MLGEIENAILAKIRTAQDNLFHYRYETMIVLNGSDKSPLVESRVRHFPALWLHHADHDAEPVQDGEGLHLSPHFVLWIQARSLLNQSQTRQQAVPGLYQMMLDNAGLLAGETFQHEIAPLRLVSFEILPDRLDSGSYLVTGKLRFETRFTLEPQEAEPSALEHFVLHWLQHHETVTSKWPQESGGAT